MFTPRTPRSKKRLAVVVLLVLAWNLGIAQHSEQIQRLDVYEQSLRKYHAEKVKVELTEYKEMTKRKWWYYMPQLGFNLGLPSVNGGTSQIVQLDVQKQQNRARIAGIIANSVMEFRTDLLHLRQLYETALIIAEELNELLQIAKLQSTIFAVSEEANRQQQIKPVEYQQALLSYQQQRLAHEAKRRVYRLKIIEVENLARYRFPFSDSLDVQPVQDSTHSEQAVSALRPTRQKN